MANSKYYEVLLLALSMVHSASSIHRAVCCNSSTWGCRMFTFRLQIFHDICTLSWSHRSNLKCLTKLRCSVCHK